MLDRRNCLLHGRHKLRWKDDRRVPLDGKFGHGLEHTELECDRMQRDNVRRLSELYRCLELSLCCDDLGMAFAFSLCLLGHRKLHIIGKLDVFNLDGPSLPRPKVRFVRQSHF